MTTSRKLGMLFLHALPFDGSMWAGQRDLLPGASHMPTLYPLGEDIEAWAAAALAEIPEERLVVVGCSIGGSCALEVAAAAPERVAGLVLIGTKAIHNPDPALKTIALRTLEFRGLEAAWDIFWAPLLSNTATEPVRRAARETCLRQRSDDIARGVRAFHERKSRDGILRRFPGPVVVVSGAEDAAPGPETSAAQAATAPRGRLEIVPDCGHYVPMEKPEALNSILRDLLVAEGALP